jgi:urease accessory protein
MKKHAPLLALLPITISHPAIAAGNAPNVIAGLLHPILGFDHLLAMIAVGLLSIQLGGRHVLRLPACFVVMLFIGAVLGLLETPFPQVEGIISLSVVILGLAIVTQARIGVWIAYPVVAIFALFHGHAHGAEIPTLGSPSAFIAGFLAASAFLHLLGVGIGKIARTRYVRGILGAGCAGIGVHMVLLTYGLI